MQTISLIITFFMTNLLFTIILTRPTIYIVFVCLRYDYRGYEDCQNSDKLA